MLGTPNTDRQTRRREDTRREILDAAWAVVQEAGWSGLTQRAVATRLGLSERTVAGHISRLREKYGAQTLFQLGWLMRGSRRD